MGYEFVWLSAYRFHQRMVDRMRLGRVFLAGDAAHIMSPFGARGMNSGIADADNLAWKLWLVLSGLSPEALLDSYDAERRAAAADNLAVTAATMHFMVSAGPLRRLARNAILRASLRLKRMRRLVNSGRLAQPFVYADSPIVLPARGRRRAARQAAVPVPGAVAPDGPCRVPGAPGVTRLRELVGPAFLGLWFGPADRGERGAGQLAASPPRAPARLYAVLPAEPPHPPERARPGAVAGVEALVDHDGALARAYCAEPGLLAVIRPDGHLAALLPDAAPDAFAATVEHACGGHAGGHAGVAATGIRA